MRKEIKMSRHRIFFFPLQCVLICVCAIYGNWLCLRFYKFQSRENVQEMRKHYIQSFNIFLPHSFISFFLSTLFLTERGKYVVFVSDLFYNKTTEQPLTPEPYKFPWWPRWVQHSAVLSDFQSASAKPRRSRQKMALMLQQHQGKGHGAGGACWAAARHRAQCGHPEHCSKACSSSLHHLLLHTTAERHQMLLLLNAVVGQGILPMPLPQIVLFPGF